MLHNHRLGLTRGCSGRGLQIGDGTGLLGRGVGRGKHFTFVACYIKLKVQDVHHCKKKTLRYEVFYSLLNRFFFLNQLIYSKIKLSIGKRMQGKGLNFQR